MKRILCIIVSLFVSLTVTACETNVREQMSTEIQNFQDVSLGISDESKGLDEADSANSEIISPDLSEPFTNGSFTVQTPVLPWSDADVETAWLMTEHYDKMTTFSDCVFIDFTGDGVAEMLFVCGHDKIFYIFQKNGNIVSLLAKSNLDAHICNGAFLTEPPLTESDFIGVELDEYYSRDKFAVLEDNDKQKYLVIISWSGTLGEVCEIKKIEIQGEKITFPVVYRWGLFKEVGNSSVNMIMKYQKYNEQGYESVQQK